MTSLIESLKNCFENYLFTDEGDISNYLGVNINNNLDGTFKLSQLHLVGKIINHPRFMLPSSTKLKEKPAGKSLLNKDEYILEIKGVCSYRAAVLILSYIQGYTLP